MLVYQRVGVFGTRSCFDPRARRNWHSCKWKSWSEHNKLRFGPGWVGPGRPCVPSLRRKKHMF